ncbi:phage baseplate assembly protein V [Cellulomonas sp. HZM]|uniref:phage baseplate assembly protein V n=1 Tax=Cellulomonas sp. HZM TaxID=1454010 RepID=UPI0012DFD20B|nr:phage baseplate assembly protein V [Cellulomonas sp. HZM]
MTWPRITVAGQELQEKWLDRLVELRVHHGLRSIGRATLTFTDPGYELAQDSALAVGARVSVASAVRSSDVLHAGTVTSVETELAPRDGVRLVVTVDDKALEMTRSSGAATYHETTLSALVTTLAQECGLRATVSGLPATTVPFLLRNDTPLGLVDEIATRYGCDWVVEGDALLVWAAATANAPDAGTVTLTTQRDLLALSVRQVSDAPTEVHVRGWDPAAQEAVSATATSPDARSGRAPATPSGKKFVRTEAHVGASTQEEAKLLAQGLAARTGRMVARGRALFTPALTVGGTVTIADAGPTSGAYYVREVTHVVDASGSRTSFVAGDRDPVRLADPWTQDPAPSFRRSGLAVGVVDNLQDPGALGRVSVSLSTASDEAKSAWARVLQPGAGNGRGHVFLPDVGDEVLVGFENDDVSRPVVLGGLYGQRSKPSRAVVDGNGKLVAHVISTRSGHVVELSEGEAEGEQHILLKLASGAQLRVGKDEVSLSAPDGVPLRLSSGGASITFDGNGKITLDASELAVSTKQATTISAQGDVSITAVKGFQAKGTTATLKADAKGSVEASGILEVKGAMVKIN